MLLYYRLDIYKSLLALVKYKLKNDEVFCLFCREGTSDT